MAGQDYYLRVDSFNENGITEAACCIARRRIINNCKEFGMMRKQILWNSDWLFARGDTPEKATPVTLPHTWNAKDGQDGGNDYYRGTCLYTRR